MAQEERIQLVPKKKMNKKSGKKSGMHKMPGGHMMSDAEMDKKMKNKKRMGSRY